MLTLNGPPPLLLKETQRCDLFEGGTWRPDARALDRIGLETALRNHVLPLIPAGAVTPVAAASISDFRRVEKHLQALLGPVICRLSTKPAIEAQLLSMRQAHLARRAEQRTPLAESCRGWSTRKLALLGVTVVTLILVCLVRAPHVLTWTFFGWALITLVAVTGLRTVAAASHLIHTRRAARTENNEQRGNNPPCYLPRISLLVPLYSERDIAARLVKRIAALDYPRDRLEVALILEWGDRTTEEALRATNLPDWMRIVRVPQGDLRTKPRAMNYAVDFLNGEIIGIYDAEDAPDRDQLMKVALTFDHAPQNVACLQGALDFYNAPTNLLTRCFTIDYAIWFRLVLPGFERLGLVLPLGGTTVFFRRNALEALGRWDAHNVTEDADLGLRLARRGYRCAFLSTVTEEEATTTIPAWIRQRSRWIKGYAMTWAVHMRDPLQLFGELGPLRFLPSRSFFSGLSANFFWRLSYGRSG